MSIPTSAIHQTLILGEDHEPQRQLRVKILAIRGNQVKLGFEVESDSSVHSWEVWEHIRDRAGSLQTQSSTRSRFEAWLNCRARGASPVEARTPQEEVETYT